MRLESTISSRLLMGIRRIASAAAAATLLLAGVQPAVAGTATLSGATTNTCTIANGPTPIIAVSGTGDVTIQCTSTSSPGLLSLTQSSYQWVPTQAFPATVQRTGGSTGAVSVDWSVNVANCASTGATSGTINFAAGDATNKAIPFTTTATTGTCPVTLSNFTTGTQGTPITAAVSIVDPNADVTFRFNPASTSTTFGGAAVTFTAVREGGTNGEWVVPITLTGSMAGVPGTGTLSGPAALNTSAYPYQLTFSANVTSHTLTYTPPAAAPPTVTPPYTMAFNLGTPVAGGAGTPPGQNASVPPTPTGQPTHTVTVTTGCPAPGSNVTQISAPTVASPTAQRYAVSGPQGQIISIPAPATTFRVRTFETTATPAAGFGTSFGLARCPADAPSGGQSGPVPCKKQGGWSGNTLDIGQSAILFPPNCYWTPAERQNPWYFNVKIDYCPTGMSCQFFMQIEY